MLSGYVGTKLVNEAINLIEKAENEEAEIELLNLDHDLGESDNLEIIQRLQILNVMPHVCRHAYCNNMDKSGMNPKTL